MQPSFRTTAVLFAIAVALTAYAYVFERDRAGEESAGLLFADLTVNDIVEIRIEPGAQAEVRELGIRPRPVLLRYEPDEFGGLSRWRIVEPFPFDALTARVDGILIGILELERIAPVLLDGGVETVLGDDGPAMTVRFRTRGPIEREHVIEVGRDHPDTQARLAYYRVNGQDLFLSRARFKEKNFNVGLRDLRSRAVFPVPKEDAVRLTAERPGRRTLELVRRRGTQRWYIEKPSAGRADMEIVPALLDRLNTWRVEEFVTDALEDPARYGLDRPRMVIELEHRRGRIHRYEIADPPGGEPKGRVFAREPGLPFVYAIGEAGLADLEKPAEEFRSRYLLQLGAAEIEEVTGRVVAADGERRFRLWLEEKAAERVDRRPTSTWMVTDERLGETYRADALVVRSFLDRLRHLEVRRYLDGELEPPIASALDDPPRADLQVRLRAEARPVRVVFHAAPESAGLREFELVAYREPDGPGDLLERTIVPTSIPRNLGDGGIYFRDRDLSTFATNDIRTLRIKTSSPEASWMLAQIEGTWHLPVDTVRRDPDLSLQQLTINRAVRGLTRGFFRVERFLPDETDLEKLELTPTRSRISIEVELGGGIEGFSTLRIGARRHQSPGQEYYGRLDTVDMPVLLPNSLVEDFLELIEHLDSITLRG